MQLSSAEQQLWDKYASGTELVLGTGDPTADDFDPLSWGDDRTIRAEVIARLMLGAADQVPGQSARVYLNGARILGELNLNGATLTQELTIINSYFDTTPDFGSVQARSIWFDGCRLPGFGGWSMEITSTLALFNCRIDNVQLRSARVGLDLELSGLRAGTGGDTWAVDASGIVVAGGMRADRLVAIGGLNLTGARVGPWLDLTGAEITVDTDSAALIATGLTAEGLVNASDLKANGLVDLLGVNINGALMLNNARIHLPQRPDGEHGQALSLEQARIGQHLLAPGLHLEGQLNLLGTKVEGVLELRGATLHSPGAIACFADQLQAGRFDGDEMVVEGQISLIGARIGRSVTFDRANFRFPEGIALDAMQITVAHNLELTEVRAEGGISVYSGEIGGDLVLTGADPLAGAAVRPEQADVTAAGVAFDGRQAQVAKSMVFSNVTVAGQVTLESATIGDINGLLPVFKNQPGSEALVLDDCTVHRDIRLTELEAEGSVSAAGLKVGSDFKIYSARVSGTVSLENSTIGADTVLSYVTADNLSLTNLTAGAAVTIAGSTIKEHVSLDDVNAAGSVSLAGSTLGVLSANRMTAKRFTPTPEARLLAMDRANISEISFRPDEWPQFVSLDGLRYAELENEAGWRELLKRNSSLFGFRMQPYTYLANYFRSTGHDDRARQVMLTAQRAQRRARPWPLRVPGWLMDLFAGYGYAPGRALSILIAAWGFGWWHYREPLVAADLVIPTSPFGLEAQHIEPVGVALIAIGWALSIAVLPAVTRSLGRN